MAVLFTLSPTSHPEVQCHRIPLLKISRQSGPKQRVHISIRSALGDAFVLQSECTDTMLGVRDCRLYDDIAGDMSSLIAGKVSTVAVAKEEDVPIHSSVESEAFVESLKCFLLRLRYTTTKWVQQ